MEQYIDGYLLSVPKANIEAYRKMAELAGSIWLEYGALEFRECVADDIDGEGFGSFSAAASAREGETVVFRGSRSPARPNATASMPRSWPTRA